MTDYIILVNMSDPDDDWFQTTHYCNGLGGVLAGSEKDCIFCQGKPNDGTGTTASCITGICGGSGCTTCTGPCSDCNGDDCKEEKKCKGSGSCDDCKCEKKCECGAASVGGMHADYCPLYEKE